MEYLSDIAALWRNQYPPGAVRQHSILEKLFFTPLLLSRVLSLANIWHLRYFYLKDTVIVFNLILHDVVHLLHSSHYIIS